MEIVLLVGVGTISILLLLFAMGVKFRTTKLPRSQTMSPSAMAGATLGEPAVNYFQMDPFRATLRSGRVAVRDLVERLLVAYEPSKCTTSENMDVVIGDLGMAVASLPENWAVPLYFKISDIQKYYLLMILETAWRTTKVITEEEKEIVRDVPRLFHALSEKIEWFGRSDLERELRFFDSLLQ